MKRNNMESSPFLFLGTNGGKGMELCMTKRHLVYRNGNSLCQIYEFGWGNQKESTWKHLLNLYINQATMGKITFLHLSLWISLFNFCHWILLYYFVWIILQILCERLSCIFCDHESKRKIKNNLLVWGNLIKMISNKFERWVASHYLSFQNHILQPFLTM